MTYLTVAVWEYLNNAIDWIPYCADVCHQLERAHVSNLTKLYLRDVDTKLSEYVVNVSKLEQINVRTGKARSIRRRLCQLTPGLPGSTVGLGICWQWLADQFGRWCPYPTKVQHSIEESFQNHDQQIDLERLYTGLPYIIDFSTMSQTRKKFGTVRPLRRSVTRSYPYAKNDTGKDSSSSSDSSLPVSLPKATRSSKKVQSQRNSQKSKNNPKKELSPTDTETPSKSFSSIGAKLRSWMKPSVSSDSVPVCDQAASTSTQSEEGVKNKWKKSKSIIKSRPVTVKNIEASSDDQSNIDSIFDKCCTILQNPPSENCIICCEELTTASSYGENDDDIVVQFTTCEHAFHKSCLKAMIDTTNVTSYIQCPTCKTIYGKKIGNQPEGSMKYYSIPDSLPSFSGFRTICILYEFRCGIQGPDHPEPGESYFVTGFPRLCYLPDNEIGNKILKMLCVAWQRRLIFTIGTSMTTGCKNVVTWNEIHHKTEFGSNHSGHGFPDPHYLDNVLLELSSHGVTENEPDVLNFQL